MAIDLTALNATVAATLAEVTRAEGLAASAIAALQGQAAAILKAVQDALDADDAADAGTIAVVTAAINDTSAAFVQSNDDLAAALAANPGPSAKR